MQRSGATAADNMTTIYTQMSPKLVKTTFSQLYFEMKILLSMLVTDHVGREGSAVSCVHLLPGFLLNHFLHVYGS